MTTNRDKNSIFRANALNNFNVINDRFDLFTVVGYSSWIWLSFAVTFLLGLSVWAVYGSIPINVEGKGIILPKDGKALSIYSSYEGTVNSILVKQGMLIKKGEILATIHNPYIDEELTFKKRKFQENQDNYQKFKTEYAVAMEEITAKTKQNDKNLNERLIHLQDKISILNSLYLKKVDLFNREYLTLIDLEKAKEEYITAKEELSILMQNIFESKLKNRAERDQLNEKLKRYEADYLEAKHSYDLKVLEKSNGSIIVSTEDGILNNIAIAEGDHILSGRQLFTIISRINTDKLEAVVFINHSDGKKIIEGMDVNVLPNEFSAYDYGYLKGKVLSITEYPASRDSVNTYLGNLNLVDEYFSGGVPYLVNVALSTDTKNKSGLKWTTKNGSPYKVKHGSTVTAKIITKRSSPISIVLKYFT